MESEIKTIIVTGTNRGIGYSYVELLLEKQKLNQHPKHKIIMTARDKPKGEESIKKLLQKYPDSDLHFEQLDVGNIESIDQFFDIFKEKYQNLDLLVNNAGVLVPGDVFRKDFQTQENIEFILSINFYGVVYLSEKLLPLLKNNGKIVTVSSSAGFLKYQPEEGRNILSDPNLTKQQLFEISKDYKESCANKTMKNWSYSAYFFSKVMVNTYHRFVLTKLLKQDQLSFSLCPGHCSTDMGFVGAKDQQNTPALTPEQGAAHVMYVSMDIPFKANDSWNGSFFSYGDKQPSQF